MKRAFTHHHQGPNECLGGCCIVVVNDREKGLPMFFGKPFYYTLSQNIQVC